MLRKAYRVLAKLRPTYGLAGCEEGRLSASIAFTTESGLMGLVPTGTEIGDRLCVILGYEWPMLLRENPTMKGEYQLVGPCSMHGILDGEVLKGASIDTAVIN
jgi:hypothetical protein